MSAISVPIPPGVIDSNWGLMDEWKSKYGELRRHKMQGRGCLLASEQAPHPEAQLLILVYRTYALQLVHYDADNTDLVVVTLLEDRYFLTATCITEILRLI